MIVATTTNGVADSVPVKVSAPVDRIVLSVASLSLLRGNGSSVGAELRDATNHVIDDRTINWSSSDPSVVSASPTGSLRALKDRTGAPHGRVGRQDGDDTGHSLDPPWITSSSRQPRWHSCRWGRRFRSPTSSFRSPAEWSTASNQKFTSAVADDCHGGFQRRRHRGEQRPRQDHDRHRWLDHDGQRDGRTGSCVVDDFTHSGQHRGDRRIESVHDGVPRRQRQEDRDSQSHLGIVRLVRRDSYRHDRHRQQSLVIMLARQRSPP